MRRFAIIVMLAVLPVPSMAADKIPMTIAAFSTPALASDQFYRNMGAYIADAPDEPFDVKLLVRGELGSDEAHFYALRRGRIQIAGVGFQSVATAVPELTVLNAAYLLESWPEVDFVYETAVVPFINALLAEHGIVGLRLFGAAWHGIYAKTPIYVPTDAVGRRFRALIDPASQLFVRALGADTFQVASTEVVTALQTGLIEAGETNSHVYNITGTSNDAPFFTRTRNTPTVIAILANKPWFDELTPAQQQRVMTAHPSMVESGTALRADEERLLAEAAASHVTVIEPTTEQLALWRAVGLSTHQALIDEVGGRAQELYDMVMAAKADFRALNAAN
ncbi:MAG: TRAP transporter substrate-binding protein DctP [Rhodospirillaceae bacterium]|nr:TRAP transporter substrate-binding protein DctP [Rhodospirillaceae bacterium]MBT5242224.1 TRAP transporter substrate-binding protein DctP [Rhodospirillaceae bacterium]MBT5565952.1 TRAP transporter substrate-binding protein DctP [Rhodospirillaceae bacterium]MBT6088628.1 TRAP transporter substrate-binding protein DctP [Rhodospirillaceae bacterium]MBT6962375.1 TRAP transporter substrate-binding protein DctP [Rhodospirillaceae bacterium]